MVSTQVALIHSVRGRRWEKVMDRELAIEHRIVEFNPFADMEIYRRKFDLHFTDVIWKVQGMATIKNALSHQRLLINVFCWWNEMLP